MEPHVDRFTGRAAEYDRYRERYDPQIVLPLLREWCGITSQWRIADVGAGTGMLADVFLANGNHVVAVEPNAEMRTLCEELHQGDALLAVRDGTAENTGLPEASFDMVCVGRALHWFDLERSLLEFRRILKAGGWVAVVAFGRNDAGRDENVAVEMLLRGDGELARSTRAGYAVYAALKGAFAGGGFHHCEIEGETQLDWESLRGMMISLSYAPMPGDERFPEFERQLRELFERFEKDGKVTLGTRYWIDVGRW